MIEFMEDQLSFVLSHLKNSDKSALHKVADGAGVSFHTLLKIVNGTTKSPGYTTLKPVYDFLRSSTCT